MMYSIRTRLRSALIRSTGILAGLLAVYAAVQMLAYLIRGIVTQRPISTMFAMGGSKVLARNHAELVLSNAKAFASAYVRQAYQTGVPLGEEAARQVIDQNMIGQALIFTFNSAKNVAAYSATNLAYGSYFAAKTLASGVNIAGHAVRDSSLYCATRAASRCRRTFIG